MHMPVMDGLEATARILELKTGVPIIAMTANVMTSDQEIYRVRGMSGCVGKPFTSQELWRCLMKYLKPVGWQPVNGAQHTQAEKELRRKLVSNFMRDNRDRNKYGEIIKALEGKDIKLAHRLAHTLKGNAGQLGMTLLQQAAAEVERRLADGENLASEDQLRVLETELAAALMQFAAELGDAGSLPPEPPSDTLHAGALDIHSALALIEKLEPMLEMGNPECREYIDSLRRIYGNEDLINQMIRQMDDLELDQAIVSLTELKGRLK